MAVAKQLTENNSLRVFNPAAPEEMVAEVVRVEAKDLDPVLARAREAQRFWRGVPTAERVAGLEKFLAGIMAAREEIAAAITREQGKPLRESRGETMKSVSEGHAMGAHALAAGAAGVASARAGVRNTIVRRPRGVIAAITPWNFPILTPMRKIAPALAFGNAIVLKPSEFTPTAALILERIARETLPANLLQVVCGDGSLGHALSATAIDGITFTGSVGVGRQVAANAATNLAEVSLELGGKNAAVVNDSEDLPKAITAIVGAAMQCAGQRCTAISRVVVADAIADAVVEALAEACGALKVGDGQSDDTDIGAITTSAQFGKIADLVEAGRREGARLVVGGDKATVPERPSGRFFTPTVFDQVAPGMRIAGEEIFGPVISVLRYRNFDEAMQLVNGTPYGLSASLFSNRNDLINRFIDEVQSGMIHINHGTTPDSHMPFGGVANSGLGAYSVGASSEAFYTTEHAVYNLHA